MRTGLFLLAGFLLLAASLLLGRLFSATYPSASVVATVTYVALWFVIAGANMWIGVAKAGYSVAEELPIFALIFLLPAAVGIILKWKVL
ncbi:MAG TPA: hypothetical protein VLD36_18445 [Burkholderiales bacterium]|jgi:hypothetical protein|nr:hypothetical protein [Burkholderiales bacterium]